MLTRRLQRIERLFQLKKMDEMRRLGKENRIKEERGDIGELWIEKNH